MQSSPLQIGWAEADITPLRPVLIAGQFHARLSEGVMDPLRTTALALQSDGEQAVFVCCDVVCISDDLRDLVRQKLAQKTAEIEPMKVVLNATHTHTGPEMRLPSLVAGDIPYLGTGIENEAMPVEEYLDFASERIVEAIVSAWHSRTAGGVAYGLGYAVISRNRRWVDVDGKSTMYGLNPPLYDKFRHIEGFEDHSLNLLAIYDEAGELSGLIINVPCTSQVSEHLFEISADFWHEARQELRRRFGEKIHILPQCSAAGDTAPRPIFEREANARMLELKGRSEREEIAQRIADAVEEILPHIQCTIDNTPVLQHRVEVVEIPANKLSQADADSAHHEAETLRASFEAEQQKLDDDPQSRANPRWYQVPSALHRRMQWHLGVVERYEHQKTHPTRSAEVHVLRLGDVVFATNPFEYYLDFGVQIKVRSPFIQTFLVQLAGAGTYVPSPRSVQGGGYGSVPASNPIGPEGGQVLADRTVEMLKSLWEEEQSTP